MGRIKRTRRRSSDIEDKLLDGGPSCSKEKRRETAMLNTFQWNIQNFRSFVRLTEGKIISPPFVLRNRKSICLGNTIWHIQLTLVDDYVQVSLHLQEELSIEQNHGGVKVKVKLCLFNDDEEEIYDSGLLDDAIFGGREGQPFGNEILDTFPRSDMISKNYYIQNDTFRIKINLWINDGSNEIVSPTKDQPGAEYSDQNNFIQWLDSPEFSNVSIVTEDLSFNAHKIILSSRSPVFAAMFRSTMTESLTNTVTIKGFSSRTVRGMLQFIYCGSVEAVKEDYQELLKIAEMYQLEVLKAECIKTAVSEMSSENVIDILILGDQHNAPELKSKAVHFINSNNGNSLLSFGNENGTFKQFAQEYPDLILEIYENLRKNSFTLHSSEESNAVIEEITGFTTIYNMD